jgi:hypothetical protein
MVKNTDFLGSVDSNPYNFRHYNMSNFAMYVNANRSRRVSLQILDMKRLQLWLIGQFSRIRAYTIQILAIKLLTTCTLTAISFFFLTSHLMRPLLKDMCHLQPAAIFDWNLNSPKLYLKPSTVYCIEYDSSVRIYALRTVSTGY